MGKSGQFRLPSVSTVETNHFSLSHDRTFNHGDDGIEEWTEMNVDIDSPPADIQNKAMVYSPVIERHLRQITSLGDYFLRDVKSGEEITCNYLSFIGDKADWAEEVGM